MIVTTTHEHHQRMRSVATMFRHVSASNEEAQRQLEIPPKAKPKAKTV